MPDYPDSAFAAALAAVIAEPSVGDTLAARIITRSALDAAAPVLAAPYEDLLSSLWLYIKWFWVTRQLTTPQKELFADAVDASSARMAAAEGPEFGPASKADRWWQDSAQPVQEDR